MKNIKIKFLDFWDGFTEIGFPLYEILSEHYDIELSDTPDYIIYSCFGHEHLQYDCIRIFYTGECLVPDFNICDYAIGYDHIVFDDRYCRMPLYYLYQKEYALALNKHLYADEIFRDSDRGFCSFTVSNSNCAIERTEILRILNTYKLVDSGGRYLNNIGGPIADKLEFDKKHKFSIVFENCYSRGYITEKIVQAFAAGCIPIYWGSPDIADEFNPKAFINCHEYDSFDDVLKRVIEVDSNPQLYKEMLCEPIQPVMMDFGVEQFLKHIFDPDLTEAYRRTKGMFTEKHTQEQKMIAKLSSNTFMRVRKIFGLINNFRNKTI